MTFFVHRSILWLLYLFKIENITGSSENISVYSFGFEVSEIPDFIPEEGTLNYYEMTLIFTILTRCDTQ